MYFKCRDWLEAGGAIGQDADLKTELSAAEYRFTSNGRIILEGKDKIKERMGRSPDLADALALTFAHPVRLADNSKYRQARRMGRAPKAGSM